MSEWKAKPCPGCGSVVDTDECPYPGNRESTLWHVGCVGPCGWICIGKTPEDAIEQWNTRETTEMSEWQPIETAPKGGGAESVKDPNWIEPPAIMLFFLDDDKVIAYWDWHYLDWCSNENGRPLSDVFQDGPTHWMPLPNPPECNS